MTNIVSGMNENLSKESHGRHLITVDKFFTLFLEELEQNKRLWPYYKFLQDPKKLKFRNFCQRLQYLIDNIGTKEQSIWDCGCGYGTTALFLAMNGYRVFGTTLEFYFAEIDARKKFWSKYGDGSLFECTYEDIYSTNYVNRFHTIILQDTLHHLEPIGKALSIIKSSLKENGRLLVLEENGLNPIQNIKLFLRRGFKKTISHYDEILDRTILMGNENIRGINKWKSIMKLHGFVVDDRSIQFIRLYPPFMFRDYEETISRELLLASKYPLLKSILYFGINFCCSQD